MAAAAAARNSLSYYSALYVHPRILISRPTPSLPTLDLIAQNEFHEARARAAELLCKFLSDSSGFRESWKDRGVVRGTCWLFESELCVFLR